MTGKDVVHEIDRRNVVRRRKRPVGAVLLFGFVVLDSLKLHTLHHVFGEPAGGIIAAILLIAAVLWVVWKR
jgi:hypothetical protein